MKLNARQVDTAKPKDKASTSWLMVEASTSRLNLMAENTGGSSIV
ncbi:hypothetical protein RBI21_05645 [Klebsiella pneumoniae]|nr:hypothetical protein RBI21_05645 [Klebsiella pneumoniae]